jgi:hypothetical protein
LQRITENVRISDDFICARGDFNESEARTIRAADDVREANRREVCSAYQAVVKESTRLKQQLRAMLNEHCVRLEKGFRLCHPKAITRLLVLREWTPARRMLLQQLHGSLVAVRARRTLLRRHMAQEIVAEEALLRSTRLCGINLVTLRSSGGGG